MTPEMVSQARPYILITGASSGLGAAVAEEVARVGGYHLLLVARRAERLQEVEKRCRAISPEIEVRLLTLDVSGDDFADRLRESLKDISLVQFVFANAGVAAAGRTDKLGVADFERNFDVNVGGVVKTLFGSMDALKSSAGRFVIIGSINSYLALPLGAPYNMGKFAVRALAESLYSERSLLGFDVSIVCPGPVTTEILSVNNKGEKISGQADPMPNALSARVAAHRILKQTRRGRREIFLSWDARLVVSVQRHFPNLALWMTRVVFSRTSQKFLKLVGQVNPDVV